jgi:hypothetical protein
MGHPDPPNHGGQQRRLTRLVRPYVLGRGERATWFHDDQAADAQADGPFAPGAPDESAAPGSRGTTASSGSETMAGEPAVVREPAGRRRRGGSAGRTWPGTAVSRRWLLALARHGDSVAIGTIAGIVAFAGCAFLLLPYYAPRAAAPRCPNEHCHVAAGQAPRTTPPRTATAEATAHPAAGHSATLFASMPAPATPAELTPPATTPPATSLPATTPPATTPAATTPAPPRASTPPPPAPSPSPTQQGSTVSVSYTVIQQWSGGFQGQFTIVNNGNTAINGWELSAVLPGDRIDTTWDATFHTDGDILIMNPPSYQVTIPPGTSLQENFVAQGTTTSPAGCTFDGAAC